MEVTSAPCALRATTTDTVVETSMNGTCVSVYGLDDTGKPIKHKFHTSGAWNSCFLSKNALFLLEGGNCIRGFNIVSGQEVSRVLLHDEYKLAAGIHTRNGARSSVLAVAEDRMTLVRDSTNPKPLDLSEIIRGLGAPVAVLLYAQPRRLVVWAVFPGIARVAAFGLAGALPRAVVDISLKGTSFCGACLDRERGVVELRDVAGTFSTYAPVPPFELLWNDRACDAGAQPDLFAKLLGAEATRQATRWEPRLAAPAAAGVRPFVSAISDLFVPLVVFSALCGLASGALLAAPGWPRD
eukprot:gnl/Chilomastix_cuspidata/4680.p1 GENE.gnl/Chilomastix_cuspidata/4680~~gnl/Chilomastix_cuspidata/4680.p1  ORF type:complete len:297 (-),score=49.64 gnl/Chilomastix_cuspidata/4680:44-934(-)